MMTHKGTLRIATQRLVLRRFIIGDVEDMFRNYAGDDEVTRFLSFPSYKYAEDIKPFISSVIESYSFANTYHWAIQYEGEIIGSISVVRSDEQNSSYELGYCIGRKFWNKGIMTEAVKVVIGFLFEQVGVHRITAKHDVKNPASGRVMKKAGMRYEGTFIGYYIRRNGDISDSLVYAILADE